MGIRSTAATLDHTLGLRSFSPPEIELSQTFIATVLQPERRLQDACLELLLSYLNLWGSFLFSRWCGIPPILTVFVFVPCFRELANFCLWLAELFIISENGLCSSCFIGTKNVMKCVFEWSLKVEENNLAPRSWITRSFEEIINRRCKTQK
jgi:hypothetical protein